MKHVFIAKVCEPEYGSSTSMVFGVENNVVTFVEDTSTHVPNYFWDYWSPRELNLIGMPLQYAFLMLSTKFVDEDGKYRHPWVSIEMLK